MRSISLLSLALLLPAAAAWAGGDDVAPRKSFRQSSTYPFVFRPESYLATGGPVPMRFGPPPPPCHERRAPSLTPAAQGVPREEPAIPVEKTPPAPEPEPVEPEPATPEPLFPPPTDAPAPQPGAHDFSKVPDEVLEYFKNAEGRPLRRDYLFDPIFQPALPNDLPKSKATYRVQ